MSALITREKTCTTEAYIIQRPKLVKEFRVTKATLARRVAITLGNAESNRSLWTSQCVRS